MDYVRAPACAGTFYPREAGRLAQSVDAMLAAPFSPNEEIPKALIAPHAGYVYSGPVAGDAYRLVSGAKIEKVVLLGPAHRVWFKGLALPEASAFSTPLGTVRIDRESREKISALPQVSESDKVHELEHSLEVQLPFLQRTLGKFALAPLAVGEASAEEVSEVIDSLWGGAETLILVSSDLSHFLSSDEANSRDEETSRDILNLRLLSSHEQACGMTPINGLILAARKYGLKPRLVGLKNSGDTAGDKSRVVGYGAFAFTEEK